MPFWVSADDDAKGSNSGTKRLWNSTPPSLEYLKADGARTGSVIVRSGVGFNQFNGSPVSDGEQRKYY